MHANGLILATSDVDEAALDAHRRWITTTGHPELMALDGVVDVRFYEADPTLQALRGPNPDAAFAPGSSRFAELVFVRGDDLRALAKQLGRDGRKVAATAPSPVSARHVELFALSWVQTPADSPLSEAAGLWAPHCGVQLAFGEVADPAMRPVIADWYRDVHAPDALEVDGFVAAILATSLDNEGRHFVVFLLDRTPADAVASIRARVPDWQARGRSPSPGRASRALFNGPFERLAGGTPR